MKHHGEASEHDLNKGSQYTEDYSNVKSGSRVRARPEGGEVLQSRIHPVPATLLDLRDDAWQVELEMNLRAAQVTTGFGSER
jgi:hypothetical protein